MFVVRTTWLATLNMLLKNSVAVLKLKCILHPPTQKKSQTRKFNYEITIFHPEGPANLSGNYILPKKNARSSEWSVSPQLW